MRIIRTRKHVVAVQRLIHHPVYGVDLRYVICLVAGAVGIPMEIPAVLIKSHQPLPRQIPVVNLERVHHSACSGETSQPPPIQIRMERMRKRVDKRRRKITKIKTIVLPVVLLPGIRNTSCYDQGCVINHPEHHQIG